MYYDGVVSHPEPDIPESKVKWALGSTTVNKASGCDGIPVELFKILKEECKSKSELERGIMSQQSEWLSLKSLQIINAREVVEKQEPLLHCWWEYKLV